MIEGRPKPKERKVFMALCDQIKSDTNSITLKASYDTVPNNPMPKDKRDEAKK